MLQISSLTHQGKTAVCLSNITGGTFYQAYISRNNRGAILGPVLIWAIWSMTELVTSQLPGDWVYRSAYLRVFLIGLVLQIILQRFSDGILPEKPPKPIPLEDEEGESPPARRPAE